MAEKSSVISQVKLSKLPLIISVYSEPQNSSIAKLLKLIRFSPKYSMKD